MIKRWKSLFCKIVIQRKVICVPVYCLLVVIFFLKFIISCMIICFNFRVMANPEELPKIDWSYYKANASNKAIIEQFEKTYRSLKIPYPDDKGAYSAVAAEEKEAVSNFFIRVQIVDNYLMKFFV